MFPSWLVFLLLVLFGAGMLYVGKNIGYSDGFRDGRSSAKDASPSVNRWE